MLIIYQHLIDAIIAQAQAGHPLEICGVIAGPAGSDTPLRLLPMENMARSERFFQFDPSEQLRLWREMDARDEAPVVIYHSHTDSAAYPSREDLLYAAEPHAHYLIVSAPPGEAPSVRSYRIGQGRPVEERVKVVTAYRDARAPQLSTPATMA